MEYYVYALIDPTNNNYPFYIGKGVNNRIKQHFIEVDKSRNENDNFLIDDIADALIDEAKIEKEISPKTERILELLDRGYSFNDIGRIVAKDLDESTAFTLEAFIIKFVYGIENLTNKIEGEHSERFRAYGDWSCLEGFDIPINKKRGIYSEDRTQKLKMMLAEGIDKPLLKIREAFPELVFDESNILDSGELGIEADVLGTRIKIFTRRKNIQIELRGRKKQQHEWLRQHLLKLGHHIKRADNIFLPEIWKGSKNMTTSPEIAIKRVKLLIEIINANCKEELSEEAFKLLQ